MSSSPADPEEPEVPVDSWTPCPESVSIRYADFKIPSSDEDRTIALWSSLDIKNGNVTVTSQTTPSNLLLRFRLGTERKLSLTPSVLVMWIHTLLISQIIVILEKYSHK